MKNEEFEKRLNALGIKKSEFAEIAKIPYKTLMNWNLKGETPKWVAPFLEYYQKAQDLDKILEMMQKYKGS